MLLWVSLLTWSRRSGFLLDSGEEIFQDGFHLLIIEGLEFNLCLNLSYWFLLRILFNLLLCTIIDFIFRQLVLIFKCLLICSLNQFIILNIFWSFLLWNLFFFLSDRFFLVIFLHNCFHYRLCVTFTFDMLLVVNILLDKIISIDLTL